MQMKPVPMQCGASKDNETACKKVGSYVFQSVLAMTRSLAHLLNRNNEWHVNQIGRLTLFFLACFTLNWSYIQTPTCRLKEEASLLFKVNVVFLEGGKYSAFTSARFIATRAHFLLGLVTFAVHPGSCVRFIINISIYVTGRWLRFDILLFCGVLHAVKCSTLEK